MRPLTPREWQEHYVELRPFVLEEWPALPQGELEAIADDWDGLVALIQDRTGLSSDVIGQRLHKLDVAELGIGTGGTGRQPGAQPGAQAGTEAEAQGGTEDQHASLAQLRLGAGFAERDRAMVEQRLSKLNRRLRAFPADATDIELSVKDREATSQKVTLECRLPHYGRIVATSHEADLRDALMDVREDLWRQIDDAVSRRKEGVR